MSSKTNDVGKPKQIVSNNATIGYFKFQPPLVKSKRSTHTQI